jgi:hypothetical protein
VPEDWVKITPAWAKIYDLREVKFSVPDVPDLSCLPEPIRHGNDKPLKMLLKSCLSVFSGTRLISYCFLWLSYRQDIPGIARHVRHEVDKPFNTREIFHAG